jgi:hypothetical protein
MFLVACNDKREEAAAIINDPLADLYVPSTLDSPPIDGKIPVDLLPPQ